MIRGFFMKGVESRRFSFPIRFLRIFSLSDLVIILRHLHLVFILGYAFLHIHPILCLGRRFANIWNAPICQRRSFGEATPSKSATYLSSGWDRFYWSCMMKICAYPQVSNFHHRRSSRGDRCYRRCKIKICAYPKYLTSIIVGHRDGMDLTGNV